VLVAQSVRYFDEVYAQLGVLLTEDDVVGESFYNPRLPAVVSDLQALGLLVESNGALCVFPEGFGYAATDLAAIRDRVDRLGAEVLVYVVGAPQAQHLEMCFAVARMAGWLDAGAQAVHVAFGHVLGADRKMFRSRGGETVKLVDLLDEAVQRAAVAVSSRNPDLPESERDRLARVVGVGAVKYADLATDRTKDYVFDWDRMLSFEGNTGPYLQYAHARIMSIFRRAGIDPSAPSGPFAPAEPAERALALALLGFADALAGAQALWSPSRVCAYLFDVASAFTTFYETCPVLQAPDDATRAGRLALSQLTARVLAQGLDVLGIGAPDQM